MQKISQILEELDSLFAKGDTEKIGLFLEKQISVFKENQETDNLITMLNEMIGFLRDMGQFEAGEEYCNWLYSLVEEKNYKGTIAYATTCLNIANFKRAKKEYEASEKFYLEVLPVYDVFLGVKVLL